MRQRVEFFYRLGQIGVPDSNVSDGEIEAEIRAADGATGERRAGLDVHGRQGQEG